MKAVVYMATLHLYGPQVSSKHRVRFFMSGNGPAHLCILRIDPSLQARNLNVAAAHFLLGTLELEIFFCHLSVCDRRPLFGEDIMIRLLKNLELREVAIFDNF